MLSEDVTFERLSDDISVAISKEHRFGTDAFLLADFAAPRHKDRVIDLCSGCGIVGLLMMRDFSPSCVTAVELQKKAHMLAELTKRRCGLECFIPKNCDLKEYTSPHQADLITCNPPYKTPGTGAVSASEAEAVARHEIECSILDVCRAAKRNLKFGGRLCICNRPERLLDCISAMRDCKIEPKRLRSVHKTAEDKAWLILLEGRLGGSGFMKIEPPLLVYEGGEYSKEMKRIYKIQGAK